MSIYDPISQGFIDNEQTYSLYSTSGPLDLGNGLIISDGTLLVTAAAGGTVQSVTAGTGLSGGIITVSGTINLNPATASTLGGIKVGNNLSVSPDGTLSAQPPGIGTITSVVAGTGLSGGGTTGNVTLNLNVASASALGGVSVGQGINVNPSGQISLAAATDSTAGGVQLATSAEVITGVEATKAVTPATLAAKVASTTAPGIVQLTDSVATDSSTLAATATAVKVANTAATNAQTTADAALPKAGGTMSGPIVFAAGQTFPGVAFPPASTTAPGVVQVGSGLSVTPGGLLSATNVGTVTSVTAGEGLGAPATGGQITTAGVIKILPPTVDGTKLGGVKAGPNITISSDGTISVSTTSFLLTNNPYAYTEYIWPIPRLAPALPCPGDIGQVLTIIDSTTGALGWTNSGSIATVTSGTGVTATTTGSNVTVSLTTIPSVTPGTYGGQGIIPIVAVNSYGQVVSTGTANTYGPFTDVSPTTPAIDLDFVNNTLNRKITLAGNAVINNPLNAQSGQRGTLVIKQNASSVYSLTWGSSWKFANGLFYQGNPTLSATDLLEFVVIAGDYIVVTNIVSKVS